jgi:6-pyruvoyltetrahydropterin/6-carboxytetrahydropterin synthase
MDVGFLKDIVPSAENFAKAIWDELKPHIKGCELHCVKLQETENIYVEYFG